MVIRTGWRIVAGAVGWSKCGSMEVRVRMMAGKEGDGVWDCGMLVGVVWVRYVDGRRDGLRACYMLELKERERDRDREEERRGEKRPEEQ